MAFTLEEIEKAIQTELQTGSFFSTDYKESPNYSIIIDYLTGKSNSLPGITADYGINIWSALRYLLKDIENPSPNDQLVLDICHHPDITRYLESFYIFWLADYIFAHPAEKAFQTAIAQFRQLGYSDDEIFTHFVFNIEYDDKLKQAALGPTPLHAFLVNKIKRSGNLILPVNRYYGWTTDWSYLYFTLLENERPSQATEYAIEGARLRSKEIIEFLLAYRDGYYMPDIIAFVKNTRQGSYSLESRVAAAIFLYQCDKVYAGLLTELAHLYLADYRTTILNDTYEQGLHISLSGEEETSYLPYSALAFHFLLQLDKGEALRILHELQQEKIKLDKSTLDVVYQNLQQEALPFLQKALTQDTAGIEFLKTAVNLLVKGFDTAVYLPFLWDAVTSKSKPMRELLARLLAEKDPAAETKAIALLEHKKSEARQTAAAILSYFSSAATQAAIVKVLNKETNDNTRDMLLEAVAESLPKEVDAAFIAGMIEAARNRGKLDKPVESWLNESELPALYFKDGQPLDADAIRFLLYRMSRVKTMRSDAEAKLVINLVDKEKSTDFAKQIIKLFIDKDTKPDYKYLLALAALLGNDEVVDKIRTTVNNWIEVNRLKMAEYGVGALALQGSNKALRWVEWYSRKYRSKKGAVGTAALSALEAAAEELNITPFELGDRIVPDFGFDGLFKHFTVAGEEYRAFIDSNFKIAFFNDDNKKLKSLPAAADADLKEEFKAIGKEVRDVVRSQSLRLEHYLMVQRRWTVDHWQQFFLNNPVMFIYATKLLWGIYDQNGQVQQCFLCQEDTTLIDVDDNELELPEGMQIGIVHPLQLPAATLQSWKQKFFDNSIDPVFPQLDRPINRLPEEERSLRIVLRFENTNTAPGSIKGTLDRNGWRKGPAADAGMIDMFIKDDYAGRIKAVLEVEGVFAAGFDTDMDPKLGRLYFIDATKQKSRWINGPESDNDERLIPLGAVPEVFYSEVVSGISAIKKRSVS